VRAQRCRRRAARATQQPAPRLGSGHGCRRGQRPRRLQAAVDDRGVCGRRRAAAGGAAA
jgi:hypothetical protein